MKVDYPSEPERVAIWIPLYMSLHEGGKGRNSSNHYVLLCEPVGDYPQNFTIWPIRIIESRRVDQYKTKIMMQNSVWDDVLSCRDKATRIVLLCIPSDSIDELPERLQYEYSTVSWIYSHCSSRRRLVP